MKKSIFTKQTGLTLIELMVALAVSAILIIGVITVFVNSKRTYLVNEQVAALQENMRFATHFLTQDVRGAGYAGCNPANIKNLLNPAGSGYTNTLFNFDAAVSGWEATGTGPGANVTLSTIPAGWKDPSGAGLPTSLAGKVKNGSDVLVIKTTKAIEGINPAGNTPPNAATIALNGNSGIKQGTIIIISDCTLDGKTDVFQTISNNSSALSRGAGGGFNPGNVDPSSTNLSHQYTTDAQILTTHTRAYYVGTGASGRSALFRMDYDTGTTTPKAQELVEGVDSMQVLYGEDLTADDFRTPSQYVTADKIIDPGAISSVQISLLLSTPQSIAGKKDSKTYDMLGATTATRVNVTPPTDNRIRKAITFTVLMRNRAMLLK